MLFKKIRMKNTAKILGIVLGLFVIVSCSSTNTTSQTVNRKWMLIEFQDFTKDFLMKKGANLDLSNKDQYGANMGCNRMFMKGDFKTNGMVTFSKIGSTMMYCDDAMKLEDAFVKALPTVNYYRTDGHFLTLTSEDGSSMKFVAADWD